MRILSISHKMAAVACLMLACAIYIFLPWISVEHMLVLPFLFLNGLTSLVVAVKAYTTASVKIQIRNMYHSLEIGWIAFIIQLGVYIAMLIISTELLNNVLFNTYETRIVDNDLSILIGTYLGDSAVFIFDKLRLSMGIGISALMFTVLIDERF